MNMLPPKSDLKKTMSDAVEKAEAGAAELSETVVTTAKKYPLHTALAAGTIGLFAGLFFVRKKK